MPRIEIDSDNLECLYEVTLKLQVSVDGKVPNMSPEERRQVLMENVIAYLDATDGDAEENTWEARARQWIKSLIFDRVKLLAVTNIGKEG